VESRLELYCTTSVDNMIRCSTALFCNDVVAVVELQRPCAGRTWEEKVLILYIGEMEAEWKPGHVLE